MRYRDPLANPAPLIRRVYSYVAYRIGDGPDAEDVTSEVFERALRYRASYDQARGHALPWLLGIARTCVDARQIGEILGMKTNAVEVALHRALARVRAELEEAPPEAHPSRAEPAPRVTP